MWLKTLFSRLVTDRAPKLTIKGSCNGCGACCRQLILFDGQGLVNNRLRFEQLKEKFPVYSRFEVESEGSTGEAWRFRCLLLGEDMCCQDYENRPKICRDYPRIEMIQQGGRLPQECSYTVINSHFESLLKSAHQDIKKRR